MSTLMEKMTSNVIELELSDENMVSSIKQHLIHLLNTKRSSMPHLMDYGLPDIAEVYQDMPESIGRLKKEMKQVIEKYEPRLKEIRIIRADFKNNDSVLTLELDARTLTDQSVHFKTELRPHSLVSIA